MTATADGVRCELRTLAARKNSSAEQARREQRERRGLRHGGDISEYRNAGEFCARGVIGLLNGEVVFAGEVRISDDAEAMLAWPHSGFHVHDDVWVPDGDMEFAKRLARNCARNPLALERLPYDGSTVRRSACQLVMTRDYG